MRKRFAECKSHATSGYSCAAASGEVPLESFRQASMTGDTEFH